jgi:Rrf2 family protein
VLSQRSKYALKALIALARIAPGDTLMIADIAVREAIPRKFLELILVDLKRLGLVYSRRGRSGGYALAKPPEEITFGQVIRLVEGPLALLPCASKSAYRRCADCTAEPACPLRLLLVEVREATAAVLDGRTIASVLPRTVARRKKVRA